MALEITGGGIGGSNLVAGAGTSSAQFKMPASPALSVESVLATIDNSAGGDTVATLIVRDQSGEVIATKRQDDVIPAGDTGTATFALRLGDNGGQIRFRRVNTGAWLDIRTTSSEGVTHDSIFLLAFEDFRVEAGRDFDFDGFLGRDFNVTMGNDVNLFPSNDANIQATNNANLSGGNITNVQGTNGLNLQGGDLLSTNSKVGFFNTPPVAQAATPTTLAQVITILRNLGFAA